MKRLYKVVYLKNTRSYTKVVVKLLTRLSAPASPSRVLLAELPVMVLASPLPVPLIAVVPVRVRFSTLLPRV